MKTNNLTRRDFLKAGAVSVAVCPLLLAGTTLAAPEKRILVVYFSMPETTKPDRMTEEEANSTVVIDGKVLGNTQYFAYVIQENTEADIFRIEAENPYPAVHAPLLERAKSEQDKNARPALKAKIDNLDQYDVVFLGYPIWYYQLPMILRTFLEQHDFSGKTIVPFNTHGGSRSSGTVEVISRMQPHAAVHRRGLAISRDHMENARPEIEKWLNGLDILKTK